jgi:AraC-like DNA-binding protein
MDPPPDTPPPPLRDWHLVDDDGPERSAPRGFIHLGVAEEFYGLLQDRVTDPDALIAEGELDPRLFGSARNLVSITVLGNFLHLCAERTNCPHFGLLVGQQATLDSLRLVGSLMRASETLGDALRALEAHLKAQYRGAAVYVEIGTGVAALSLAFYEPMGKGASYIYEGGLATLVRAVRELCSPDWAPTEVLIPRRVPADVGPYHTFFRAPVRFNEETAAVVFPAGLLSWRLPSANPAVRTALEQRIIELERAAPPDLVDELRRIVRLELLKRRSSAREVARRFSVHRRTLARYLKAAGTGLRTVADQVRFEVAQQLLAETDISLVQISAALDFSEPAAFTHAFEKWSGVAPSIWRAQHRTDTVGYAQTPVE